MSTEGLLDSLLNILSDTNGILVSIDDVEMNIHEVSAEGKEPVSTGANAVISLLDSVRGHFEDARATLIQKLDVLIGAKTPKPLPELPEELEDLEEEELPPLEEEELTLEEEK